MIDEASVDAVDGSWHGPGLRRPLYGSYCFDRIPATLRALLRGTGGGLPRATERAERVAAVWIDAFGWAARSRHGAHPVLHAFDEDGVVAKLTSQFPSTTTAHAVTLGADLAVGAHGVYEWHVYEPSLDRVVCPLRHALAGGPGGGLLALGATAATLFPYESFASSLAREGVTVLSTMPREIAGSPFSTWAFGAARSLPDEPDVVGRALRSAPAPALVFAYLPAYDAVAHESGPESPAADTAARGCLDWLAALCEELRGSRTLVLLFADHGQVTTDPDATVFLDRSYPEILDSLVVGRDGLPLPLAGSPRDAFLHVRPDAVDRVVADLSTALPSGTIVRPSHELVAEGWFGAPSRRLEERLGAVTILPPPSAPIAWWGADGTYTTRLVGHHGGALPDETDIFLASRVV